MTHFFVKIYHFLKARPLITWGSLLLLFVCFGYLSSQIHLEEDINKLMPSYKNEDGTTKLAFADLKIKDKTFVLFSLAQDISTAGEENGLESVELLADVCDEFMDSLLSVDRDSVVGDVFYRLDENLLPDGIDYLMEHIPAFIDTAAYSQFDALLTREHFQQQMRQNHDDMLGEFGEMYPELIECDPLGMRNVLSAPMKSMMGSGTYRTVDNHFFVPDSTVCIAFITPRYSSTNTGQGSAMFKMLNEQIKQFREKHPEVQITYHGTPASGFYNSSQIKHDLRTTIAGALIIVLLFLLLCFRRWDSIPLLLLPVVFGTLFGLSMMYLLKGEFSLLALGIGSVVLGVALSYVLHVLTHHQYVADIELLLRDQVKPVILGCITTIGSFAGLIFIKTDLLRDFGLFAAFAILGTTLFSLIWLPQILELRGHKGKAVGFPAIINRIIDYPLDQQKPLLVAVLLVVITGVGAYLVGGTRFDADMHNLGYKAPMTTHSEQLLREKTFTGDKTRYFASKGKTMEEAISNFAMLDHKLDSLSRLGLVKSYTHTNQIIVSIEMQRQRIKAWKDFWTPDRLDRVRTLISQTAPQADLNPEAFETFFDIASRDYEPDPLYKTGLIPEGFQSTLLEKSYGGDYLCFTSVRCKNDSVRSSGSDYIRICDAIATDPNLLVLDTYYYTTDTLLQMNEDFNVLQWLSMLFVLVVLLLSFGFNVKQTLIGFMPILLSWLVVLGAMVIFGVRFNIISIIISTFIFGIGVDYSIFMMDGLTGHRRLQLDNPDDGSGLSTVDENKLRYHKTAILLSAITLIATVSSMLLAKHPAIRSVGFSTLVGLMSAVVLTYVLQPAVYRWLNRKQKK